MNQDDNIFYSTTDLDAVKAHLRKNPPQSIVQGVHSIVQEAEKIIAQPVYSVMDKKTLPPSGDLHDYWHPAPYWWPDPDSPSGFPYIKKDGERIPGTTLFDRDL